MLTLCASLAIATAGVAVYYLHREMVDLVRGAATRILEFKALLEWIDDQIWP